jgi:hypothetical protein
LQFTEVQAGRVAIVRWTAEHVRIAACALHVLLAPVLLVSTAERGRGMSRCWATGRRPRGKSSASGDE